MATGGWSGLWNGLTAAPNVTNTQHDLIGQKGQTINRKIARLTRTRGGALAQGSEYALPGESYVRAVAPTNSQNSVTALGGARTVETITQTALAEASMQATVEKDNAPTYPTDASGNGGGGKIAADGSIRF